MRKTVYTLIIFLFLIAIETTFGQQNGSGSFSPECPTANASDIVPLDVNKALVCAIGQNQTHRYSIEVKRNESIYLKIDQRGVDVGETIKGLNGFSKVRDYPNDIWGLEMFSFIAPSTERIILEVSATDNKTPKGPYKITLFKRLQPTPEDVARSDAEELFMSAIDPNNKDQPRKIKLLGDAVAKWRVSKDDYGLATGLTSWLFARSANMELIDKKDEILALEAEALGIWKVQKDLPRCVQVMLLIARLYQMNAMVTDAEKAFLDAAKLWDVPDAPPMPEITMGVYNNLATTQQNLGKYQEAIDAFEKAIGAAAEAKNDFLEGQISNNLGSLFLDIDEADSAETYLKRAQILLEKANGRDTALWATLRLNQGLLAASQMNWTTASDFLNESLDLRKKVDLRRVYEVHHALGYLYYLQKRTGEAVEQYERALKEATRVDHKVITLLNIGGLFLDRGDPEKALTKFNEAADLLPKIDATEISWLVQASIAQANLRQKRYQMAINAFEHVCTFIENKRYQLPRSTWRTKFTAGRHEVYEGLAEALMRSYEQSGDIRYAERAFTVSEQSRARGLLDQMTENLQDPAGTDASLVTKYRSLQQSLKAVEYESEQRAFNNAPVPLQRAAYKESERLRSQLDEIEGRIRVSNKQLAGFLRPPILNFDQLKRLVDPGTLAIEYMTGRSGGYYWLLSNNGLIGTGTLPSEADIADKVANLSRSLGIGSTTQSSFVEANKSLSSILIDGKISGAPEKKIMFAPDGPLYKVPFAALLLPEDPEPGRSPSYLVIKRSVSIIPSLTTLAVQREINDRHKPAPKTLAIFADPVYDNTEEAHNCESRPIAFKNIPIQPYRGPAGSNSPIGPDSGVNSGKVPSGPLRLERLSFTRSEMLGILGLGIPGDVFRACGFDANYNTFKSAGLSQYRFIHFATHGFSSSNLTGLTGLALSLFNPSRQPTPEGIIRLRDIYGLRLNADLVVLSACDTAGGIEVRGEGVINLSRAFLAAGASNVVASLWKVNDNRRTSELMKEFYRNLIRLKLPPDVALQNAQKQAIALYGEQDPAIWATFLVYGDGRLAGR